MRILLWDFRAVSANVSEKVQTHVKLYSFYSVHKPETRKPVKFKENVLERSVTFQELRSGHELGVRGVHGCGFLIYLSFCHSLMQL